MAETVKQLAEKVRIPVAELLEKLKAADIAVTDAEQEISDAQKQALLAFIMRSKASVGAGKGKAKAPEFVAAPLNLIVLKVQLKQQLPYAAKSVVFNYLPLKLNNLLCRKQLKRRCLKLQRMLKRPQKQQ